MAAKQVSPQAALLMLAVVLRGAPEQSIVFEDSARASAWQSTHRVVVSQPPLPTRLDGHQALQRCVVQASQKDAS